MIIAFFGHSEYMSSLEDEDKLMSFLESKVKNYPCEFYFGGYGGFDRFAYTCSKKFKKKHPWVKLKLIVPYISKKHTENSDLSESEKLDEIIYPALESVPPKFAILHRNKWIVDQADIIITYLTRSYGGAYKTYLYAARKKKEIYNMAEI